MFQTLATLIVVVLMGLAASACSGGAAPAPPPTPTTEVEPAAPTATLPPAPTPTTLPAPTATAALAPASAPKPTSAPTPAATAVVVRPAPTSEPREPGPPSGTNYVASKFESALNAGDVDGVMALFEPDAQVKVPPDLYVGENQIRNWVSYLADNHFAIEPGFRTIVGDRGSWPAEVRSDYLDRIGLPSLDGTASIELRDGLIHTYQFVLTEDSAHRHRAAQLAASEVLQDPVIVGQDAANVYGFNDVFHDSAGRLVSYRDVLTAEPGSGPFYDLGGQPIVIRSGI